jgi:hypothetical protein
MPAEVKNTIDVKELLEILKDIERWVRAVRAVVGTLPKGTRMTVPDPAPILGLKINRDCPPPE